MFFLQMSGFPGSGKSTLSREIARRLDAVIVDHDVTKTALLESTSQHRLCIRLQLIRTARSRRIYRTSSPIFRRLIDHLMHPVTFFWMYFFNHFLYFYALQLIIIHIHLVSYLEGGIHT